MTATKLESSGAMKVLIAIPLFLFAVACGKETAKTDGKVTYVKGTAVIEHIEADGSKKSRPAKPGDDGKVFPGDTIQTGEDGTVVFEVSGAQMEIQRNTRFVYERGGDDKQVYLQGGNAWTSVSKLEGARKFTLRTPATVAGVRGTKFFTFTDGKNTGTCHCEGKISFTNNATGKEEVNDRDYLMYYRGSKSVKVFTDDFKKMGIPLGHNHSELDNSSIGKKNNLTPAQLQKVADYVDKKFAALK